MRFRSVPAAALLLTFAFAVPSVVSAQIEEPRIPLQTALSELNLFRSEYADYYNKKDAAALAAMYAPDAIVINADGSVWVGWDAIKNGMMQQAPTYPHLIITTDSMAVYGHTAVDEGTSTMHPAAGGELKAHYLVVLRRGMTDWKIIRLALVPVP